MPLYEYQCRKCGHRFETIQSFSARRLKKCPKCRKGLLDKLVSSPAVHFKGSGWYVTDYARKGKPGGDSSSDSGGGDAAGGESKGPKESKEGKSGSDKPAAKEGGRSEPARKSSRKD